MLSLFKILIMKILIHVFRVAIYKRFNSKAALSHSGIEELEIIVFRKIRKLDSLLLVYATLI